MPLSASSPLGTICVFDTFPDGYGGSTVTLQPQTMAISLGATETIRNSAPFPPKASTALTRAITAAAVGSIASLVLILVLLVLFCVHYTSASRDGNNGARNRGRFNRDYGTTLWPVCPKGPWRSSEESKKVIWVAILRRGQLFADGAQRVFRWRRRSAVREEQHIIPLYASRQQSLHSSSTLPDTASLLQIQTPLSSIVFEQLGPGRALLSELPPTHWPSEQISRHFKDQLIREILNPSSEQPLPLTVVPALYVDPREVELGPNPVILSHLLRSSPEHFIPESSARQVSPEMSEREYRYEPLGPYVYPESPNAGVSAAASPGSSTSAYGSTPLYSPMISSEASPSESGMSAETVSPSSTFSAEGASPLPQYYAHADQSCICRTCDRVFRTAGLQRIHYNRKHNLRFACQDCEKSFGLKKDLERHKLSVHQKHFSSTPVYTCPNEGCATPGKKFTRKDNCERHVKQCKETLAVKAVRQ